MKLRHPEKINNPINPIKKKPYWIRSKIIDTQKKKIELGGLIFFPEEIKETESNISWKASDVKIY